MDGSDTSICNISKTAAKRLLVYFFSHVGARSWLSTLYKVPVCLRSQQNNLFSLLKSCVSTLNEENVRTR